MIIVTCMYHRNLLTNLTNTSIFKTIIKNYVPNTYLILVNNTNFGSYIIHVIIVLNLFTQFLHINYKIEIFQIIS